MAINIYNNLVQKNSHLFLQRKIESGKNHHWFGELPCVGVDRYEITRLPQQYLATNGVSTCFAICMRGKLQNGNEMRLLCHTAHAVAFARLFNLLKGDLLFEGCRRDSLEAYVIGGQLPDSEKDDTGTLPEQIEVLQLAQLDPTIKEVRFNVAKGDDNLSVVFGPDKLLISKKKLFEEPSDEEEIGYPLYRDRTDLVGAPLDEDNHSCTLVSQLSGV